MKTNAVSVARQKAMTRSGGLQSSLSEDFTISLTDRSQVQRGKPLIRLKKIQKGDWQSSVGRNSVLRLTISQTRPGSVGCCATVSLGKKYLQRQ